MTPLTTLCYTGPMEFDLDNFLLETEKAFEKIGLYQYGPAHLGVVPGPDNPQPQMLSGEFELAEALADGKDEIFLAMMFRIGDVAFSERVLEPEAFRERTEFEKIMPTNELEMIRNELAEEAKSWDEGLD